MTIMLTWYYYLISLFRVACDWIVFVDHQWWLSQEWKKPFTSCNRWEKQIVKDALILYWKVSEKRSTLSYQPRRWWRSRHPPLQLNQFCGSSFQQGQLAIVEQSVGNPCRNRLARADRVVEGKGLVLDNSGMTDLSAWWRGSRTA